jgi:hypothetical protein
MTAAVQESRRSPFARTGGLYRLLCAVHVVREGRGDVLRESLIFVLVTWVPLAAIQLVEWLASRHVEPLFHDISLHARFLIAAPLLFFAEDTLGQRCSTALRQLSERVDPPAAERNARLGARLRTAPFEVALLTLAFFTVNFGPRGLEITSGPFGAWYRIVAWPLGSFLLLRALWSWIVWCVVLASFARLPLHANALHPDRSGGLGFLRLPSQGFCAVLTAVSCVVSGAWATQILFGARRFSIASAALPFAVFLVTALVVTLGPLVALVPQLYRARLDGLTRYSDFANAYTRRFHERWLQGPADGSLLGTPDIQSLADLSNAHEVVRKTRIVPFDAETLAAVTLSLAVPLLPLALLEVPFSEVLRKLLGLILGGSAS